MAGLTQTQVQLALAALVVILLFSYLSIFQSCPREHTRHAFHSQPLRLKLDHKPSPCSCSAKSAILKNIIPKDQYDMVVLRREKEFQEYKTRTNSVLSTLLLASANSPLQYPTQGFIVQPLKATLIPGLALYPENRDSYKISLNVSKGILSLALPTEGVRIDGNGEMRLTLEAESLFILNNELTKVSYASTHYQINSVDLAYFQFEEHIASFPINIKELEMPVLYDMGTDINSQVTITTKTFLRYRELNNLLSSIRKFYSTIKVIVADDSISPEPVKGENIQHYIMPPGQGWFAGRNLAVSQVITKYFLWVDDDFVFTEDTKIEKLVEVMEAVPELDVVGGSVMGNQYFFSFVYEEGDNDGGCLERRSNRRLGALPGQPKCSLVSGVVNFFLARTDAVRKVGFDPKLKRVAHSEFFMDGLGSLLVATCSHVKIGHQAQQKNKKYMAFRQPARQDTNFKLQLHFFKNHLKCIQY